MPYFDADKHFTYAPRLPRSTWKATCTASSTGFDGTQLKPIELDYSKCEICGGSGLVKTEIRTGRTQYKQCECM